jgi:hypothetical protein
MLSGGQRSLTNFNNMNAIGNDTELLEIERTAKKKLVSASLIIIQMANKLLKRR